MDSFCCHVETKPNTTSRSFNKLASEKELLWRILSFGLKFQGRTLKLPDFFGKQKKNLMDPQKEWSPPGYTIIHHDLPIPVCSIFHVSLTGKHFKIVHCYQASRWFRQTGSPNNHYIYIYVNTVHIFIQLYTLSNPSPNKKTITNYSPVFFPYFSLWNHVFITAQRDGETSSRKFSPQRSRLKTRSRGLRSKATKRILFDPSRPAPTSKKNGFQKKVHLRSLT